MREGWHDMAVNAKTAIAAILKILLIAVNFLFDCKLNEFLLNKKIYNQKEQASAQRLYRLSLWITAL
jgi:hypothetical protein